MAGQRFWCINMADPYIHTHTYCDTPVSADAIITAQSGINDADKTFFFPFPSRQLATG
jgi:hypothetical protein